MESDSQEYYEIERSGHVEIVRIKQPKLNHTALAELQGELATRIEAGARKMIINLEPVSFVDSFGVGVIADATRRMEKAGGELRLCGVAERVHMSLTITRLDQRIQILATENEALENLGG